MGQKEKEKCPAKKNQEHFLSDLNKYILPIWIQQQMMTRRVSVRHEY